MKVLQLFPKKTEGQCFSRDVGMKSTDDDSEGLDVISLRTSSAETVAMDSKASPV